MSTSERDDTIRVLIVDDEPVHRLGMRTVLDQEEDIEVVAEAGDGHEGIELAEQHAPDVVLMDVRMPRRSGIEATAAIKDVLPTCKVLVLTNSDEEADLYDAIKAGASGYLLKAITLDELAEAVRAVQRGHSTISPAMAAKLLNEFASLARQADDPPVAPGPRLTDRELQVLRLVANGKNNREIGAELYISENTVKNHVRNILEKLHLHSRMEAVMYAVRAKLLDVK